jgi:hypothetical protein
MAQLFLIIGSLKIMTSQMNMTCKGAFYTALHEIKNIMVTGR